jgi:hypothetical protein
MGFLAIKYTLLISLDQAAIAKHIGAEDGGKAAFHRRCPIMVWSGAEARRVAHISPITDLKPYRPLNTGLRFSAKASMASLLSSYLPSSAVMFCSKR